MPRIENPEHTKEHVELQCCHSTWSLTGGISRDSSEQGTEARLRVLIKCAANFEKSSPQLKETVEGHEGCFAQTEKGGTLAPLCN